MSTLVATPPEAVDDRVLTRVVEFEMPEDGDGRTLETRIVPYNVAATVSDPPDFRPYQEMFMPGAFERQLSAPDRVKILLNFEHEQGIHGTVGHGLALRDEADGLHGSFGLLRTSPGETALELVKAGVLTGLSLEFRTKASWSRTVDGIRQRVKAQIDKVSLCRFPAYPDAQVLAVRTEPPERQQELDPALDERLARLGFEPLRGSMEPAELKAAAGALTRSRRTPERAAEARKLIRYYDAAQMEPPASLRALAGS